EFPPDLAGRERAEVAMSNGVAGQEHPAGLERAQALPVEQQRPGPVRGLPVGPSGDHEGSCGDAVVAQHRQRIGQYTGQPVVEGQRELLLARLSDHFRRGGEGPAVVRRDLEVTLEVSRADVVNAPLWRADR